MAESESGVEPQELDLSLRIRPIAQILFLGLIFQLFLTKLPGFEVDIGAFKAWSLMLVDRGAWDFYGEGFHTEFTPGYLYYLWLLGGLNTIFFFSPERYELLLKLPPIAADIGSAYLLYVMLDGQKPAIRLGAALVYLLHPAVLILGPVWGQTDSILAFFLLLSVYFMSKGKLAPAAVSYVLGFCVKPQAIAVLPIFLLWGFRNFKPRDWLEAGAAGIGSLVLLLIPFFFDDPRGPFEEMRRSTENYPYTSFWAFNFWALFGRFKPDNLEFGGITYHDWGVALFLVALAGVLFVFRKENRPAMMALGVSLCMLAFYLFLTRMHERYVFASFLPMLLAIALLSDRYPTRFLAAGFVLLSALNFFNIYEVYFYYGRYFNHPEIDKSALFNFISDQTFLLSLLATLCFPLLLSLGYLLTRREEAAR